MVDLNGEPVPNVLFNIEVPELTIWVTTSGLTYQFYALTDKDEEHSSSAREEKANGEWHRVDMILKNASIKKEHILCEGDITRGEVNYYKGHCPAGIFHVKKYSRITVKDVYPGIDWVLYVNNTVPGKQSIKYDLVVHPGADPSLIKLVYEGSGDLEVQNDQVHFKNELGELMEGKLFCYQDDPSNVIVAHYQTEKTGKKIRNGFSNEISIVTAPYNTAKELIIDPQLNWSSYFGGSGLDGPISICRDNSGNIYFTGYEASANFPVLNPGGGAYYQGTLGNGPGVDDLMIVKLNNSGVLLSSTYYGGSSGEEGTGITCDASGQLFVTGQTASANFPLFNPGGGAYFQNVLSGPRDLFVLRFSPTGALTWATFYGGGQYEDNGRIVTDNAGNIFVLGATGSGNIPLVNPGGGAYFQAVFGGGAFDACILKFTSTCSLQWSTYFGGTGQDDGLWLNGGTGIDINPTGDIFISGYTNSGASFPIQNQVGAYNQGVSAGSMESYISKFNNAGVCQWSTFFGGGGNDYGNAVYCDPAGSMYIIGATNSVNFPVINPGGGAYFQAVNGGGSNDVFVSEFNGTGALVWSTYYGGSGLDAGYYNMGLGKDGSGNLFACGYSNSANLPLVNPGCSAYFQPTILGPGVNAFIAKWSSVRSLVWATFFGGNFSSDLVLDANGCLFVNGESNINGMTTLNPGGGAFFQSTFASDEGFIIKLCPTSSLTVTLSSVNILCNGQCTGTATATPAGCASPFTYSWNSSPVQTTQTATGLCAGNYTVIVTDASSNTVSSVVTITEPTALVPGISNVTNVNCNGQCTGSSTASASGGTPSYSYSWSNSQTNITATGLCAGTYTVFITDANGCTTSTTTVITQPNVLTASTASTAATCGNNNGTATVTAGGGTGPYNYSWAPSGGSNANATGLSAGTYTVFITDANGCTLSATAVVNLTGGQTVSVQSQTNVLCNGGNTGAATLFVSGGTSPYTYSWSPSGGTNITATGLSAGTYTVIVTDANGCTVTQTITITEPTAIAASATSTTAICTSGTGTASVNASGGTGPYTYNWSPSGGTNVNATGLTTGNYSCTITDANGCTFVQTVTVNSTNPLTLTTSSTQAGCTVNNGTATGTPANGTAPYTYSWNNSQTGQTATGLSAGTYTVVVTDANGCSQTQTVTVTSVNSLTVNTSATPAACGANDGTATAIPANGTAPYTYSWNNSQSTQTATGLAAGNYTVVVTDANGCSQTQTISVTQTNGPTASASAVSASVPPGGNVQLNANGGGTYSWYPSTGLSCTACQNPVATPVQTTTYCVRVTDVNGCSDSACVTITVDIPCNKDLLKTLLPNAFSPNGDFVNDGLCVPANPCIKTFLLKIYDRWGEKVFETSDVSKCWDGKYKGVELNTGVFAYYFDAVLSDDTEFSQKGNISLVK